MNEHDREPTDASAQIERARAFVRKAARHYRAMLIAVLVGILSGVVFLLLRTPPYRSETVILYTEGIRTSADAAPAGAPHEAAVRLREMLLSRQRLERLIDRFDLYRDVVEEYGRVDAVEEFREHIDFRAPGSDTYTIGFQGTSAVEARDVTAALSQSLIEEDATMRRRKAELTRDFLQVERERTDEDLRTAEEELAQFLAEHPSFALDSMLLMPGAAPTGAAIRAAEAEQSAARTSGRAPWPGSATASAVPRVAAVPAELAAEKARAEADLTAARTALSRALTRFTRQHPDVRAAEASVTRAKARLTAVTASIATALSQAAVPLSAAPAKPAPRRVTRRAARPTVEPKKSSNEELVALETEWTRLIRSVGEARSRHEQIEASFFKADIAVSSESRTKGTRMAILDPAYLPTRPAPPGRTIILGVFVALSALVGGVIAVLRAILDDRVYRVTDIENLGLPVLAAIPRERG